jgi:hypothetical protein
MSKRPTNPGRRIEISSFELLTREDGVAIQFAGKIVGTVHKIENFYEIRQRGRWVFRSLSLRSIARWMEDEIIKRITRRKK